MRIDGLICPGRGCTKHKLELQLEHFKKHINDLDRLYVGTLNINIKPYKYVVKEPTYYISYLNWDPSNIYGSGNRDSFFFIRIESMEYITHTGIKKSVDNPGYIYIPFNSLKYNYGGHIIKIWVESMDVVYLTMPVTLIVSDDAISLYKQFTTKGISNYVSSIPKRINKWISKIIQILTE